MQMQMQIEKDMLIRWSGDVGGGEGGGSGMIWDLAHQPPRSIETTAKGQVKAVLTPLALVIFSAEKRAKRSAICLLTSEAESRLLFWSPSFY